LSLTVRFKKLITIYQLAYRSSNPRITKQQELSDLLNEQIIIYIHSLTNENDAETLWLAIREQGNVISQSTFNNRLKKLVEAGLVEKRAVGYNKYLYQSGSI
jgi:Fe2+ or Zn2+ uptake regulation protein